mmetsp:Transcript_119050/g.370880  ORF Transcript_119050/g.370880 Transcript_119050/m.370880 type:complete len:88 (+) Transcript_119050:598-861(+)
MARTRVSVRAVFLDLAVSSSKVARVTWSMGVVRSITREGRNSKLQDLVPVCEAALSLGNGRRGSRRSRRIAPHCQGLQHGDLHADLG